MTTAFAESGQAVGERLATVKHIGPPRYPCHLEASCHSVSCDAEGTWPAHVADISCSGIALLLRRRFDRWALLDIDLHCPEEGQWYQLTARVVRSEQMEDGSWLVGCAFTRGLSDNELKYLV